MLCLAASLIHTEGSQDPYTSLYHYNEWFSNGYMSVNGKCFDTGYTTRMAISQFNYEGRLYADTEADDMAGNGSLMRLAPIPIVYGSDYTVAWKEGEESSKTTHSNRMPVWACGVWSVLTAKAIQGASKEELLEYLNSLHGLESTPPEFSECTSLAFLQKSREQIISSGFVVHTMESALWGFFTTDSFEEGLIRVVNLAGDADTIGAIFGTLAGAFYGWDAIPERWTSALQKSEMLENVWSELASLARKQWSNTP
jgi:ADP-ribosylglycohydrolase